MNKWKPIIPIALALVIAVSGSFLLYKWIQTKTAPKEIVKVETEAIPVAVALLDLPWGTKIQPDMITTVAFLKESLPPGYFTNAKAIENRVLISPVKQNEPIIASRLAPESVKDGGVSAIVKPGYRAVAVKGDKVIGISGFIKPGNRVDVLVTLQHPKSKLDVTKVVLENTLVLATGTQIQKNEEGEPAPVDVYTLEVSPEDGEKLGLAATQGKLQFALRNATDSETVLTKGATIPKTLESFTHPKSTAKSKWRPRSMTVEVIKGDKVSKKKVKL
jgi:pilus assembly protein CpaB